MAVLVNVRRTYPGATTAAEQAQAVLQAWSGLSDEQLEHAADVVIGLAPEEPGGPEYVADIYDLVPDANGKRWTRNAEGKVVFNGIPTKRYRHIIGKPWPHGPVFSRQGMARGAVYYSSSQLEQAAPSTTAEPMAYNGATIYVDTDGTTVVEVPSGRAVKVVAV